MTLLPCVPEQAKITNYHLNKKSISSSYQGTDYEAYEQQTMDYTMAADIHRSTLKSSMTQSSVAHHTMKRNLSTDDSNSGNVSSEEGAEKKRLRVENIVTSICQPRSPKSHDLNTNSSEQQRNKRKQFVPQQHGSVISGDPATGGDSGCNVGDIDVVTEDEPNTKSHLSSPPPLKQENTAEPKPESSSEEKMENTLLKNQIKIMSEQLQKNQQLNQELSEKISRDRYELARLTLHQPQIEMEAYIRAIRSEVNQTVKLAVREALEKHSNTTSAPLTPTTLSAAHSSSANQAFNNNNNNNREKNSSSSNPMTIREVSVAQRGSLSSSITNSTAATAALKNSIADQIKRSSSTIPSVPSPHIAHQGGVMTNPPHPALSNPLLPLAALPYYGQTLPSPFLTPNQLTSAAAAAQFNSNTMSAQLLQAAMEEELLQSHLRERDSQNKKKRTKVTDTRLSPRTASKPALDHHSNPTGIKPEFNLDPTAAASKAAFEAFGPSSALFHAGMSQMQSVFMNGFCGQPADLLRGGNRSPTNLSENSDRGPSSPELGAMSMHPALPGQNVTLTPLHLRKAKLMFFYVRYPSSVLLKNFFCDVHFNKNNTAQLVKWFSNFREFYYIQMEKYARQSIAEGMSPEQVEITPDSELYKILNLHYNRNNQIEVPRSFLETIQTTLREFIKAITCSKDREQSWKKPIYKIIARLDDSVPEYFKSQDWMEQLSD